MDLRESGIHVWGSLEVGVGEGDLSVWFPGAARRILDAVEPSEGEAGPGSYQRMPPAVDVYGLDVDRRIEPVRIEKPHHVIETPLLDLLESRRQEVLAAGNSLLLAGETRVVEWCPDRVEKDACVVVHICVNGNSGGPPPIPAEATATGQL